MEFPLLPLAIDIGDIVKFLVLFVILAGGVARLFVDANRNQKQAPPPRPQPRGAGGPPKAPQDAIRAEVDEFLRRTGRERAEAPAPQQQQPPQQKPPQQQPRRPPRIEVLDDGIQLERKPRQQAEAPRVVREKKPPVRERTKGTDERAGMGRRGERPNFGGTSQGLTLGPAVRPGLSERADERSADVRQTDERFETRMQKQFEHHASTVAAQRAVAEELRVELSRTTLADDLMRMLSSPGGVRQAVVLSEVLNRPVDRWT